MAAICQLLFQTNIIMIDMIYMRTMWISFISSLAVMLSSALASVPAMLWRRRPDPRWRHRWRHWWRRHRWRHRRGRCWRWRVVAVGCSRPYRPMIHYSLHTGLLHRYLVSGTYYR